MYSRFLNLNWDRGYGFHPDENNLWGAAHNVKLFSKLDPQFYDYGGFPIYLYSLFERKETARIVPALAQMLIVVILFVSGATLGGWRAGFFSAMFGAFSAGLLQAAHFLTVESFYGFFSLLLLFGLLYYWKSGQFRWLALASVAFGFGVATKITFWIFALPFLVVPFVPRKGNSSSFRILLEWVVVAAVVGVIILTINPYYLWRWESVRGILLYQRDIAIGKIVVFYTRQFQDTLPLFYQTIHIFPYVTGWLLLPLVGLGVVMLRREPVILLAIISAFISFAPLQIKWTRYVVQALPVLILTAGVGVAWLWEKRRWGKILAVIAVLSFLPQFFGMVSVYSSTDTRLEAAQWAETHIPKGSPMFTEAMEIGIVPFNPAHGPTTALFNFYELDEDPTGLKATELKNLIDRSTYFISPSMRVWRHVLVRPDLYPKAATFYQSLFGGSLGFTKVYDSSPDFLPLTAHSGLRPSGSKTNRLPLTFPEETFEVFDHPRVLIFKKNKK